MISRHVIILEFSPGLDFAILEIRHPHWYQVTDALKDILTDFCGSFAIVTFPSVTLFFFRLDGFPSLIPGPKVRCYPLILVYDS